MSEYVKLRAADGHELSAYVARPAGEPIAGLVVVQEIFGVNAHIRSVADGYAKDGFLAVAPALFDRIQPGIELGYEGADMQTAMGLIPKLDAEKALADIAAAMHTQPRRQARKWASLVIASAARWPGWPQRGSIPRRPWATTAAASGTTPAKNPPAPVMLHFGRQDTHIPAEEVEKVHAAHPEVEIYWYDAGHGFNCDARSSYNAAAAKEARQRSLAFLKKHLA